MNIMEDTYTHTWKKKHLTKKAQLSEKHPVNFFFVKNKITSNEFRHYFLPRSLVTTHLSYVGWNLDVISSSWQNGIMPKAVWWPKIQWVPIQNRIPLLPWKPGDWSNKVAENKLAMFGLKLENPDVHLFERNSIVALRPNVRLENFSTINQICTKINTKLNQKKIL